MGESNTQISSPLPFGNHHPTTGEPELSFGLSREENRNRVLSSPLLQGHGLFTLSKDLEVLFCFVNFSLGKS